MLPKYTFTRNAFPNPEDDYQEPWVESTSYQKRALLVIGLASLLLSGVVFTSQSFFFDISTILSRSSLSKSSATNSAATKILPDSSQDEWVEQELDDFEIGEHQVEGSVLRKRQQLEQRQIPSQASVSGSKQSSSSSDCLEGKCRYLFPVYLVEQESKGQQHLYSAAIIAAALNRTLVLPNVQDSRLSACYPHPFAYYYDEKTVDRLGFSTISQSAFLDQSNSQPSMMTGQAIEIADSQNKEVNGRWQSFDSIREAISYTGRRRAYCIKAPYAKINIKKHKAAKFYLPSNFVQEATVKHQWSTDVLDTLASDEFAEISNVNGDSPDVILLFYSQPYDPFTIQSLQSIERPSRITIQPYSHFTYAPKWTNIADAIARRLTPYVAIHWRMESLDTSKIQPCAEALIETLRKVKTDRPEIKVVYLATDYPIGLLESGQMTEVGYSSTFKTEMEHHAAIHQLITTLDSGVLGDLRLTTLARELKGSYPEFQSWESYEAGIMGIIDKSVAIRSTLFLAGAPKFCARDSSYTQQISNERVHTLLKLGTQRPKNIVNYWSVNTYEVEEAQAIERARLHRLFSSSSIDSLLDHTP